MQGLHRILTAAACLLLLAGCGQQGGAPAASTPSPIDYTQVVIPAFSADSAFRYAQEQLSFGPRIPGTRGSADCADYLSAQLRRWCDTVIEQPFRATLWDGSVVTGRNIIASLQPHLDKRILLAAHWDSRSWADHDADPARHHQPVPGANDGASGTALLMEMARIIGQQPPSVGIDIVLFDVEDQGQPEWANGSDEHSWCKGSQHWAANRHHPAYTAVYGILFDMVGTDAPRFTKEQVSRFYAPTITDKLWRTAAALGYGQVFVNLPTDPILDDHLYVNQLAGIPMVDIVQNSPSTSFFPHWHTTTDDLAQLHPQTLKLVADVVLKTLYADYPPEP